MRVLLGSAAAAALIVAGALPGFAAENDAKTAIDEQNAKFEEAFNAGDAATVASFYAEDAALFPPGAPRVDGRQAIQDFWAGAIESGLGDLDLEAVEVDGTDDMAVEVGALSLTVPAAEGGGRTEFGGKYIVVWQRGQDGTWQLYRDIWNMGD